MNRRRFENDLDEYLEGSLEPRTRGEFEAHATECAACRQKLEQARAAARTLSDAFQQAAEPLKLPAGVSPRVLSALATEKWTAREARPGIPPWLRLAWPVAAAAAVVLLVGGLALHLRQPAPVAANPPHGADRGAVSMQLSYVVPVYTFRREGRFVVDALTYETNVVSQSLELQMARLN